MSGWSSARTGIRLADSPSCGEGRGDAILAVAGMLFGAGVFVAAYGERQRLSQALGSWGKATLPEVTHASPWLWLSALALAMATGFYLLERAQKRPVPFSEFRKRRVET